MLPLYQQHNAPKIRHLSGNAGLYFERFFDRYVSDGSKVPENEKAAWLQQFNGLAGDSDALSHAAHAQMDLVKQLGGKTLLLETQWHFVTGTGYPHPVENGLNWHSVHGVPYLSGAAVKGLLRAWIEQWQYEDAQHPEKRQTLLSWFGSESKQVAAQNTGNLIFFDALPVAPVRLVTDIMTPHQGKWYADGGKIADFKQHPEAVPADWHDPIPIPFLVVSKASYLFSVAPRHPLHAEKIDLSAVLISLSDALECLGAGAKTAGGYGGFIAAEHEHPVLKSWQSKNQDIAERIATLSAEQLILAFSKDFNKTKEFYQQQGQSWEKVIALVWQIHADLIASWANSSHSNAKKAFQKLSKAREV